MKISRDADGLRFVAECAPEIGFVPEDVHCVRCGRRVHFFGENELSLLRCSACRTSGPAFSSEADLHVYLAQQWGPPAPSLLSPQHHHRRTGLVTQAAPKWALIAKMAEGSGVPEWGEYYRSLMILNFY